LGATDLKKVAAQVKDVLAGSEAWSAAWACTETPRSRSRQARRDTQGWKACIDAAPSSAVIWFAASPADHRQADTGVHEGVQEGLRELAKRAADKGVRIAFENCDMGAPGTVATGTSPTTHVVEMMFHELPVDNLG